jgi:DNA-binding NarL/FixJ family response regulator
MSDSHVTVAVHASDPISSSGMTAQLRLNSELVVLCDTEAERAQVVVIVADEVEDAVVRAIRVVHREAGSQRVVLVVARLDDAGLLAAVEAGASGILRRSEANADKIAQTVLTTARGDGAVPPDLLGRLLDQVSRFQRHILAPRGLSLTGFSERELDVLRLLAEGWDTSEIASKLAYSERTVKNVIHDITARRHLRNRSHAVALAVREGLI